MEAFEHLGREAEVVASVLQAEFAGRKVLWSAGPRRDLGGADRRRRPVAEADDEGDVKAGREATLRHALLGLDRASASSSVASCGMNSRVEVATIGLAVAKSRTCLRAGGTKDGSAKATSLDCRHRMRQSRSPSVGPAPCRVPRRQSDVHQ